jgi:membrane dipeptidase
VRRRSVQITLLVMCIVVAFFVTIPRLVDENQNKLVKKPPYAASQRAMNLHKELTIADLHADSLLWGRDLLERSTYGQVDIPRLADGNVALQVFSLPTKSPRGLNIESHCCPVKSRRESVGWDFR